MKDGVGNGTGLCLAFFFLSTVLQAEMTAADVLVEPRKVFGIRKIKTTHVPRGRGECVWP